MCNGEKIDGSASISGRKGSSKLPEVETEAEAGVLYVHSHTSQPNAPESEGGPIETAYGKARGPFQNSSEEESYWNTQGGSDN